ncbi:MAG TPA: metabolite traffic protein EboE [Kiritimatiellia bacterium]|nr:metabolite traffic protein EboE [Kiritimatiellia bacterium]HMO98412.1 metabolite traffic protein EboE [Kiritimatiellia bacterium]
MRAPVQPPVHLTYCLNVHAGERFHDQWTAVRGCATEVRDRLGITEPFGLGLRIGARALAELQSGTLADDFGVWCRDHGFYVFTLNGFPFGAFHGQPVKSAVYRPDWTDPRRRDYTMGLADVLSKWLPSGMVGSISTVPGWYAPDYTRAGDRAAARQRAGQHLGDVARHLDKLAESTGAEIRLGLEPEPWCALESSADAIDFLGEFFAGGAGSEEGVRRRRVGVCLDTCHCALADESPASAIAALRANGIALVKTQLSAALSVRPEAGWRKAWAQFIEPVYLHQTVVGSPGAWRRFVDLDAAISACDDPPDWEEARTHFHVPLHWAGSAPIYSTGSNMDESFWREITAGGCPHLEIETYTFAVLPEGVGENRLSESLSWEYRWVLDRLASILSA